MNAPEDPVGWWEAIDTMARRIVASGDAGMWREAVADPDDWARILKRALEIRMSVDCSDRNFNSAVRFLKARS